MAIQIDTPDFSVSDQIVTLNRKTYRVHNRYNSRFDYWVIDISDAQNNVILSGEKILPSKDLLTRYNKNDVLGGYLYIDSKEDVRVNRDNYGINKTHTLTFATFSEVEELGENV